MGKVALGFWKNEVSIENQLVICKSNHLGDHIRLKRKYLGLYQKDVAKLIGVSEDCITYWENKRSKPQIRHYPRIFEFLNYNPLILDVVTIGDRIKMYRTGKGLSVKRFAKNLNVETKTLTNWEKNISVPKASILKRLEKHIDI